LFEKANGFFPLLEMQSRNPKYGNRKLGSQLAAENAVCMFSTTTVQDDGRKSTDLGKGIENVRQNGAEHKLEPWE
jgi:hypothetical protein